MDHPDRLRVCAARVSCGSRSFRWPGGCPLRSRPSPCGVRQRIGMSPRAVREPDPQRGIPERLVDRVEIRLQLWNRQSHVICLQTNCGAVSIAPRARTAQGCALRFLWFRWLWAEHSPRPPSAESSSPPFAPRASPSSRSGRSGRPASNRWRRAPATRHRHTRGNRGLRSARQEASAIPASDSRCDNA